MSLAGARHAAALPKKNNLAKAYFTGVTPGTLTTSTLGSETGGTTASVVSIGASSTITTNASGTRSPRLRMAANINTSNYCEWNFGATKTRWSFTTAFEYSANPSGAAFTVFNGYASTTRLWRVQVNPSGVLGLYDSGNNLMGSGYSASINTQYRIEIRWNGSTVGYRVYAIDSLTPSHDVSGTPNAVLTIDKIRFGMTAQNLTAPVLFFDDILATDSYEWLGPPV